MRGALSLSVTACVFSCDGGLVYAHRGASHGPATLGTCTALLQFIGVGKDHHYHKVNMSHVNLSR